MAHKSSGRLFAGSTRTTASAPRSSLWCPPDRPQVGTSRGPPLLSVATTAAHSWHVCHGYYIFYATCSQDLIKPGWGPPRLALYMFFSFVAYDGRELRLVVGINSNQLASLSVAYDQVLKARGGATDSAITQQRISNLNWWVRHDAIHVSHLEARRSRAGMAPSGRDFAAKPRGGTQPSLRPGDAIATLPSLRTFNLDRFCAASFIDCAPSGRLDHRQVSVRVGTRNHYRRANCTLPPLHHAPHCRSHCHHIRPMIAGRSPGTARQNSARRGMTRSTSSVRQLPQVRSASRVL